MDGRFLAADKVIVATGGVSYPSTGSTGDGLRFAKDMGHGITEPLPALVPLVIGEPWCADLQGLSLKNVGLAMEAGGRVLYKGFGEMIFTHFGVSGPLVLSASSLYARHDAPATLAIDLKPALTPEQLDKRLLRDFAAGHNKMLKNILGGLLPAKSHSVIIALSGMAAEKRISEITKAERQGLAALLKNLKMTVTGTRGFAEAIITRGGVSIKDINPRTMESKLVGNLHFAGEVLDIDALTGGFNLQVAWSTGWCAGRRAAPGGLLANDGNKE